MRQGKGRGRQRNERAKGEERERVRGATAAASGPFGLNPTLVIHYKLKATSIHTQGKRY